MRERWADYLISAVRYNAAETHIEEVRVHDDLGDTVGPPLMIKRTTVVERLEGGYTFVTIVKSSDGSWRKGARVRVVTVRGTKFIRTDADRTAEDNLGNLPRF